MARRNVNTAVARLAGARRLQTFAESMQWDWPWIHMNDFVCGLYRLLAYIDWLAFQQNLDKASVAQVYSNTKLYCLEKMLELMNTTEPGPWYPKKVHHPLISLALKHLPKKETVPRFAIPKHWIRAGFELWDRDVFVSIFVMHGWLARRCEFLQTATVQHQVTWGMLEFCYVHEATSVITVMPREDILTHACDLVRIKPKSRKHQAEGEVREQPGRVNFTHLADPANGLIDWTGDMATVVQAHYISSQAFKLTAEQLKHQPLLTMLNGKVLSAEKLTKKLKEMAVLYGVDPETVSLHGLRIGRCTEIANGTLLTNPMAVIAVTGHKSLESMEPYVRMGLGAAEQATNESKF